MNTRNCMKKEKFATVDKTLNVNTLMIKTIRKLGAIAIILVNTDELHIVTIAYLRKFLWFFTRHQTMIIIFYHKRAKKSA